MTSVRRWPAEHTQSEARWNIGPGKVSASGAISIEFPPGANTDENAKGHRTPPTLWQRVSSGV